MSFTKYAVVSAFFILNLFNAAGASAGERQCQTQAPVTVCRSEQADFSGAAVIEIFYQGYLLPPYTDSNPWKKVGAWVRVSGPNGSATATFPMERSGQNEYLFLTNGCLVMGAYCKVFAYPQMNNVLAYAQSALGRWNSFEIQVAFVDEYGKWDSRYGQNFRFSFN